MDGSERKLRDPRELQALAHPVRMRLCQALYERGTATATELAEMVGESQANCSWHLRQLAKYGFVEEAGGGKGRNRPWRPVPHPLSWGDSDEAGEVAAASDALSTQFFEQEFAGLRDWLTWWRTDPPGWQDAANWVQNIDWLTIDELKELNEALSKIIIRRRERRDPANRPAGSRQIRIFAWAVPAAPCGDDSCVPH
ncbi:MULTISPECIES: helix-turn-helix domain-containing protein [unclassified Streptomyces]|uniref:winged helix-turn-helix domain-containing protein n=1 Tax=unclassified Streptomyces TaxID=2593676 RepID=UPI00344BDEBD